jgi:hypothetical protein
MSNRQVQVTGSRRSLLALLAAVPLAVGACGGGGGNSDGKMQDTGLQPPPAGQGVQYRITTDLGPGVEGEWCRFVQAPADGMYVNRDEVRFGPGSHHFLLYETAYQTVPTAKEDGTAVDTSSVFDCSDGATNGWKVTKLIGGSQNGQGDSMLAFPAGVAMKVEPGVVLLMNAHYVNATTKPLTPEVRINLWTVPAAQVSTQGDMLFLYNPFIKVAANGVGRARWRCPVYGDITVANVQSHMHRRGVGYAASIVGEAPFYTNDKWESVPVERFDAQGGLKIKAGSRLDYYCDYSNAEARDIFQGPRTTDEMCMLIGSYYPADPRTSNCLDDSGMQTAGEWVGNGSATCAATASCIQSALGGGGADAFKALTGCVVDADPAVAPEASALLRCIFGAKDPLTECAPQLGACQAK